MGRLDNKKSGEFGKKWILCILTNASRGNFWRYKKNLNFSQKNHVYLRIFAKSLTNGEKYDILVKNTDLGDEVHENNRKENHPAYHF